MAILIFLNLHSLQVGWVKADTKAIQAIHHQVVTHNPRVSVTYRDKTTWSLHIKDVQEDDHGVYMCQVNTDPMIAEVRRLFVVKTKPFYLWFFFFNVKEMKEFGVNFG